MPGQKTASGGSGKRLRFAARNALVTQGFRGQIVVGWGIPENRLGRVDWFVTDHLGSTKLLIDQNGQHRFTGDDDPFGINLRSIEDNNNYWHTRPILDEEQEWYSNINPIILLDTDRKEDRLAKPAATAVRVPWYVANDKPLLRVDSQRVVVLIKLAHIQSKIDRIMFKSDMDKYASEIASGIKQYLDDSFVGHPAPKR